jgi:thioredoxin 1
MASMTSEKIIDVQDSSFQELVLAAEIPVLVNFWAPWCGPCRQVTPIFEELAEEVSGKILFVKLNIDENRDLAERFGVLSIPTFILFDEGMPIDRIMGAMPKQVFQQLLERNIA